MVTSNYAFSSMISRLSTILRENTFGGAISVNMVPGGNKMDVTTSSLLQNDVIRGDAGYSSAGGSVDTDTLKVTFPVGIVSTDTFKGDDGEETIAAEKLRAYAFLSCSIILYGIMYAPARKYRKCDGVIFQAMMSCGVLLGGITMQVMAILINMEFVLERTGTTLHKIFSFLFLIIPNGIFGGVLWGLSNMCVLVSVKFLGLGVGFTLYHAVNLVLGYCIGRFEWFGVPKENPKTPLQDFSQLINVASFLLVMNVETEMHDSVSDSKEEYPEATTTDEHSGVVNGDAPMLSPGDNGNEQGDAQMPKIRSMMSVSHRGGGMLGDCNRGRMRVLGILIGLVGGFFTAVNQVPFLRWTEHAKLPCHFFVLSQTLGVFLISVSLFLVYYLMLTMLPSNPQTDKVLGLVKKKQLKKVPPFWAAAIPGSCWAMGFFFSLDGVKVLGMGIGYVLTAVGPVAVSGIISTLWFEEVQGCKNKTMFWSAIGLQAVANAILILEDSGAK